ncbi:MAG: hypothetical protein ABI983_00120 [Acidobacteriota bacterium]
MKSLFAIAVWVWLVVPAAAADRVIGLLSLPEVFGARECAPFEPGEIELHIAPNDRKAAGFIRVDRNWSFSPHGGCDGLEVSIHHGEQHEDLPTLEYDYDMPAAIVLEHREGWYKVRVHNGSAWIKASPVDLFMPLTELFDEFVGVNHQQVVQRPPRQRPGGDQRSDHASRRIGPTGARDRDPRRERAIVGPHRGAEQFGLHRRHRWPTRSDRDRLAADA